MFTRISNFTYGNYIIPNITAESVSNEIAVKIHIQKYEEQAMRMIFGDCLFEDLKLNLELDSEGYYKVKSSADEKWSWLVNGHTYDALVTDYGCGCSFSNCGKHKWDGLVKEVAVVSEKKVYESIFAPFIYFYWSLNNRTITTGTGEAKGKADGSTQATSAHKRIDAWNEFVQAASFGFPGGRISLHKFLAEHPTAFLNPVMLCFQTMTYYDI